MGQQVLNLGYSCEHGFVPLDSEIFISNVKAPRGFPFTSVTVPSVPVSLRVLYIREVSQVLHILGYAEHATANIPAI
jgi:hypothetical protein